MDASRHKFILFGITIILFSIVLYVSLLNKYAIKEIEQIPYQEPFIKTFHLKLVLDKNIIVSTKKDRELDFADYVVQQLKSFELTYTGRE